MAQPTRNFTVPPPDFGPELLRPADLFRSGASPPRVGPGIRLGPVSRFSPAARLRPAARLGPPPDSTRRPTRPGTSPPGKRLQHIPGPLQPVLRPAAWQTVAATLHAAPPPPGKRRQNIPGPLQPVFLPRRSLADGRRNAPCCSAAAYRAAGVSASAKALARRRSR